MENKTFLTLDSGLKVEVWLHAFTDDWDEWFTGDNAEQKANEWIAERRKQGYINLRIYEQLNEIDGDMIEENYVFGEGDFPS